MPTVTQTTDFVVEDSRVPSFYATLYGWKEETWDATENWDMPWTQQRDTDDKLPGSLGTSFTVRAGNGLHNKYWEMDDATRSINFPATYFGTGGTKYQTYVDLTDQFEPLNDSAFLYCDNDGDIWTIARKNTTVIDVTKLDTSTNQFKVVTTRTAQEFKGASTLYRQAGWSAHQDGNNLHFVWTDANDVSGTRYIAFYYSLWNMSTETWTISDEKIYERTDSSTDSYSDGYNAAITIRPSDSQIIVLHPHNNVTHSTQVSAAPAFSRRTGTDTWATTQIDRTTSDQWGYRWYPGGLWCILGDDSRVHFVYGGYNATTLFYEIRHRSLSSANALDTDVLVVNDTKQLEHFYVKTTFARVVDGADVYINFPYRLIDSLNLVSTGIASFKSVANPTFTTGRFTNTKGLDHNVLAYISGTARSGIMFTDDNGYANMIHSELELYIIGSPDVIDGQGGFIYHEPSKSGSGFATLRGHVGYYQDPKGVQVSGPQNQTSDETEWVYPSIGSDMGSGSANDQFSIGGTFVKGGIEYLYHGEVAHHVYSGTTPFVFYVYTLLAVPFNFVEQTTDMILKGTNTAEQTTDMRIILLVQPTVDHTTDMAIVSRQSAIQTTDMALILRPTVEQTTDMDIARIEEITVDFTRAGATLAASSEQAVTPPIIGVQQLTRKRYSTGRRIVRRDA